MAIGLGTLGLAVSAGCGGTSSSNNGDGGSTDGASGADSGGGMSITVPTIPGSATKTTQSTPLNFAIHQLYLGDTDYGAAAGNNPNAWESMGYNIDGKITTATSKNVCTLQPMGMPDYQVDGNGGIDNSFGKGIYGTVLLGVDMGASATILEDVAAGDFTLMFDVVGLDQTATQTATGLTAQAFAGGKFSATGTPTWTPSDNWPVLGGSLLSSTSPPKSTITFPDAYVVNGTWVSGSPASIPLAIAIDGISLTLTISDAVITFEHTMPNHAAKGVISGVIATSDLTAAIGNIAGFLGLCGAEVGSIQGEIASYSDINSNGQNNQGTECDGISIGLGFQADVIGQPTEVAPPGCPKANKCDTDAAVIDCGSTAPVDSGSGD
jgi:hypothetical protein